jgi:cell division protein FtsL
MLKLQNIVLFFLVLGSCVALVFVRAESRFTYAELHDLEQHRDMLEVEYGRLLIERATWSLSHLVEREAQSSLEMSRPEESVTATLLVGASQ